MKDNDAVMLPRKVQVEMRCPTRAGRDKEDSYGRQRRVRGETGENLEDIRGR